MAAGRVVPGDKESWHRDIRRKTACNDRDAEIAFCGQGRDVEEGDQSV